MNNNFDELHTSIYMKLRGPLSVEWFPTYFCNSRCHYCGGYDKKSIAEFGSLISKEKILELVKLSKECGVKSWNIGGRGGEPLLFPGLADVLKEIKKLDMTGIIITNGLLLDERTVENFITMKWDILRISLDSHLEEINDAIRGIKGNFRNIAAALGLFKKYKNTNNFGFPYIICCPVITNKNFMHIAGYIDFCLANLVDEIQFMPLINVHDNAASLALSREQKDILFESLSSFENTLGIKHNIGFIKSTYQDNSASHDENGQGEQGRKGLYCIHLWKTLVISEDGYSSPCSLIKDKISKIERTIFDAWDSKEMNALRKKILAGESIHSNCRQCCGPLRNETQNFNNYISSRISNESR